jgi:hypothetical protein
MNAYECIVLVFQDDGNLEHPRGVLGHSDLWPLHVEYDDEIECFPAMPSS